jgi:hypothetical protein
VSIVVRLGYSRRRPQIDPSEESANARASGTADQKQSKAKTVEDYLAELPDDRRVAISAVRDVILKNLPKGFEESMQYGMIRFYEGSVKK